MICDLLNESQAKLMLITYEVEIITVDVICKRCMGNIICTEQKL